MRVRVLKKQTIHQYVMKHAASRQAFDTWITLADHANWETLNDVTKTFGAADMLGNGSERIVFDIGGNNYRMICAYHFGISNVRLFIAWIGTHAEYSKLCARKEQYTINAY